MPPEICYLFLLLITSCQKKMQKNLIENISIQKGFLTPPTLQFPLLASQLIDLLLRAQYKTFIQGDAN